MEDYPVYFTSEDIPNIKIKLPTHKTCWKGCREASRLSTAIF